ncbi:MAG: DsrE/DsrF/DrsH-like family protein [Dehalococcoidales bacterium]|nr:DsrE/DsrF/DrsH-like family protein [Dehalococcoidales bacterium]
MAATETTEKEKMSIVVFSGEFDRAMAAFILATTGASMGMDVTMFFTFWGLNILKKNEGPAGGKGILRKMLNKMNRGGTKRLKLSRFHMFGMGTGMMKQFMKEKKMPTLDQFIKMAEDMGVKMMPCTTTCGIMGIEEGMFRDEVGSLAGAAYFINEARESRVTLFI